jgi:SAM-dependent methyltransferase
MAESPSFLTADDYTYRLPDHWLIPDAENLTNHFGIVHHAYVRRVVELVKQSGAQSVIEVGCGDGWNCGKLVETGLDVVGVDWSRNGIAYANLLVPKAQFFCGDLRSPEFIARFPRPFDAAIFVEVLEHIPPNDCVDALRNISGILKKGGTLVLTTPSINQPNNNPQHYRHFDESTLRELISEVGDLKILAIEGYGDVPYETRMYRILRLFENRYYSVKPARRYILNKYKDYCLNRPLDRCSGFIIKIGKSN